MSRIIKRQLWNLSKGKSIGFIESNYKNGYFIKTEKITFRQTSSNLSNGEVIELSVEKLPHQYRDEIESFMTRKIPVYLEFSIDLCGSPMKGPISNPYYADKILPLSNEVVHTKPVLYDNWQSRPTGCVAIQDKYADWIVYGAK
jgi:hypothetical protein